MSLANKIEGLRPEHFATAEMILSAYPSGIPENAYPALLALLHERMSFRAIAEVVSRCTGKPYINGYHDTLGAMSPFGTAHATPEQIEETRRVLRQHGYDEWLARPE